MADVALLRTPLYDRHVAAGARLVPFAGWEMPVQYAGSTRSTLRSGAAGIFDVSHMGESRRAARARGVLQRLLSNDVKKLAVGGAQYSVLCREDGGVLDDLFTYRLGDDRYLTVTNASNHEKDLAWFRRHADDFDVERRGPARRLGDARGPGPVRARDRRRRSPTAAAGPLHSRRAPSPVTGARLRHRLHRRGRRRAALPAATRARSGTRRCAGGAAPAGLAARDTLRLEVCYHLYGNDLMESRGPIEAGLGWCCKEPTGFIGTEAVARGARRRPRGEARPVHDRRRRHRAPGQPGRRRRRGHERHDVALARHRDRAGLRARRRAPRGHALEIDVRGRARRAVVAKPLKPAA